MSEEMTGGKIYKAIPEIMGEINAVGKNKKNAQQGFMYRGIDDVMNAINPALVKHHVFIVPEIMEQKREERTTSRGSNLIYSICKMRFRFCAEDGSNIEAVTIGEGMDSGDKATNKAMAIAFKYACFQVFCIPTEEMKDPDAETPEPSTKTTSNNKQTNDSSKGKNTGKEEAANEQMKAEAGATKIDKAKINTIRNTIMKKGLKEQTVLDYYKVKTFEEMNFDMWNNAMQMLNKYPDAK